MEYLQFLQRTPFFYAFLSPLIDKASAKMIYLYNIMETFLY